MTRNYLTYMSNVETARSNKAYEVETNRHNLVTEKETNRHNVATETETNRHNLVLEEQGWQQLAELSRHNYAIEEIQGGQLDLGFAQLAETVRHNQQTEVISMIGAQASQQQAVASQIQALASQTNAETNRISAGIQKYNAETNRINAETSQDRLKQEAHQASNQYNEQVRHNLAVEAYNSDSLDLNRTKTYAEAFKDYTTGARNVTNSISDALDLIGVLKMAQ